MLVIAFCLDNQALLYLIENWYWFLAKVKMDWTLNERSALMKSSIRSTTKSEEMREWPPDVMSPKQLLACGPPYHTILNEYDWVMIARNLHGHWYTSFLTHSMTYFVGLDCNTRNIWFLEIDHAFTKIFNCCNEANSCPISNIGFVKLFWVLA